LPHDSSRASAMNTEELLKKLDADRDAYVATLFQFHEALARTVISSSSAAQTPASPSIRPVFDRGARLSLGESERKATGAGPITYRSSFISGEDDEASDDDQALYVQDLLPSASFDDEHLRSHLKNYRWNDDAKKILEPILTGEGRMRDPHLFLTGQQSIEDRSHCSVCQVFDVGSDGAPLPLHSDHALENIPGQAMWQYVKV
jgi:hypothetical protein